MHRKQISAMEAYPLNSLDETTALNDDHDTKDSNHAESNSKKPLSGSHGKKNKLFDDDDDDDQPVKDLLLYYAKNSTMHGIPTIVGSELYRGRHIFWTCVVCIMAIFLGTVVYLQMSSYYDYPTVTSVDVRYVGENDFPAVTMCDLNQFDGKILTENLDDYTAHFVATLTESTGFYYRFRRFFSKIPPPLPSNQSSEVYIQKLIDETLRIIKNHSLTCSWGDYYWTSCPAATARITETGICFTIDVRKLSSAKPSGNITAEGGDSLPAIGNAMRGLTFYVTVSKNDRHFGMFQYQGFKAVLHEPDEEPLPRTSGFVLSGYTAVEVEISKTVKTGLPSPYKAFGSGSCVDTQLSTFENPLTRFKKYSKEVCEAECFINFVVEACGGCRHFLHPGNETLCPVKHLATCYRDAEKNYYGGHTNSSKGRSECKCPMPCTQSTYQAAVTTTHFSQTKYFLDLQKQKLNRTIDPNLAYIHLFYSDPIVTEMKQVAVYSTEGLLGNIGGQIGLFMGFSLVTVAEMLELIFLLVTRGRNLDERVKIHKKSEAAAQAALQA